jgi:hypothetical protein
MSLETWYDPDPSGPVNRGNLMCDLVDECISSGGGGSSGDAYQELFQEAEETPTIFPDRLDRPARWVSLTFGTGFEWSVQDQVWF